MVTYDRGLLRAGIATGPGQLLHSGGDIGEAGAHLSGSHAQAEVRVLGGASLGGHHDADGALDQRADSERLDEPGDQVFAGGVHEWHVRLRTGRRVGIKHGPDPALNGTRVTGSWP